MIYSIYLKFPSKVEEQPSPRTGLQTEQRELGGERGIVGSPVEAFERITAETVLTYFRFYRLKAAVYPGPCELRMEAIARPAIKTAAAKGAAELR